MASISPYGKRFISYLKREQIRKLASIRGRMDGRAPDQVRDLQISPSAVKTADGSAEVRLGRTHVVAGVKVGLGQPFPDAPDEGILMVNAEILPHASPYTEVGPPDETAIELARVVDRGLRHSRYLDLKGLWVAEGKAYVLWIDLYVINDDGNLVDAANLAAVAALRTTALPAAVRDEAGNFRLDREKRQPLRVAPAEVPIAATVGKVGNTLILDPTLEEELALEARVTFTISADAVVAVQKTMGTFSRHELEAALELAYKARDRYMEALASLSA